MFRSKGTSTGMRTLTQGENMRRHGNVVDINNRASMVAHAYSDMIALPCPIMLPVR